MWNELFPIIENILSNIGAAVAVKFITPHDNKSDTIKINLELSGDRIMGILADLQLIVSVMREVDTLLGSLPASSEVTAVKSKLDSALSVLAALGL